MILLSVYVCVSVNIDLWVNNSGTVYPVNLKFCSLIVKAILQIIIYIKKRRLLLVTRNGSQYGSKHQFFQFFKNNLKTKNEVFLTFWYVIELIKWHVFCIHNKILKRTLHRHFLGQIWQKWHIHHIRSHLAVSNHANKSLSIKFVCWFCLTLHVPKLPGL